MSTKKPLTREEFAEGLRGYNERIARAQANGDSRTANQVYMEQQQWIASIDGNRPIVGGLDPASGHGSRGV